LTSVIVGGSHLQSRGGGGHPRPFICAAELGRWDIRAFHLTFWSYCYRYRKD